jgi:hypothetical protein
LTVLNLNLSGIEKKPISQESQILLFLKISNRSIIWKSYFSFLSTEMGTLVKFSSVTFVGGRSVYIKSIMYIPEMYTMLETSTI